MIFLRNAYARIGIILIVLFFFIILFTLGIIERKGRVKAWIARSWAELVLWLFNIRQKVHGRENINPETRYVIMANHSSMLDIPILYKALPIKISFMAKRELFWIPFFGWGMKLVGHVPVHRSNPRKALRQIEAFTRNPKYLSHNIIFFPEGTRTLDGNLLEFKAGGFRYSQKFNLPVLPITISGAFKVASKNAKYVLPGDINIYIHKPVRHDQFSSPKEFMSSVREIIESEL
ncbi:MAG: lysophospholipid acyltransferase family protein [bacterium]